MTENFICYFKVAHFERLQNSLETPSRFYENQPHGICRHLSEKASKGKFLGPDKLQNHTNEGKGKEKKKGQEEKRAMVALSVFIMFLAEKNLLDTKCPFGGGNVFKKYG